MDIFYGQSIAFLVGIVASVIASGLYTVLVRRSEAKFSFRQIMEFSLDLVNSIESDEFRPDVIVSIDRNSAIIGGIESGCISRSSARV